MAHDLQKGTKRVNTKPTGKNVGYKAHKKEEQRWDAKGDPYLAKAEAIGRTKMEMADNTQRTVQLLEDGKREFMRGVVEHNGPPPKDAGAGKRYLPNA